MGYEATKGSPFQWRLRASSSHWPERIRRIGARPSVLLRRPWACEAGKVGGLDADLAAGSPERLHGALGWLRAVVVDPDTLEHRDDLAEGLLPVVPLDLHVEFHRGHVWMEVDGRHLRPVLAQEAVERDDSRFLGLHEFRDPAGIVPQLLQASFLDLERADEHERCRHLGPFLAGSHLRFEPA